MSLEEVQSRTDGEVTSETRLREFGSHIVRKDNASLWLDFDHDGLRSVMFAKPVPWKPKGMRLSPQRDLCSGDLTFFLRLEHAAVLEGATVYVDGRKIEDYPWGYPFPVSSGSHKLRIEKQGFEPILKHLHFEEDDPGELWLTITGRDIRTLAQEPKTGA